MSNAKLRITFLSALVCLFAFTAAAQASFKAIAPRNVVEGRNFSITFRLTNGEANAPKAPQLPGCTLIYGPSVSTMQSTEIINGHMSSTSSIDYSYTYSADKAGTVKVPALSVNVGGKTLSSNPTATPRPPREHSAPAHSRPNPPRHRTASRPTTCSYASPSTRPTSTSRRP